MKKLAFALAGLLALNVSAGLAAPLNDLSAGQTAAGFTVHNSDPGSNTFYLEHRFDKFTLGFQNIDWDHGGNMSDIYGQLHLTNNLRFIAGNRDFDSSSKFYLGLGVSGPLSNEWDGYASMVTGSEFKELQLGANYKLSHNVDFNLNYRSFMPDEGSNRNGLGLGATLKF